MHTETNNVEDKVDEEIIQHHDKSLNKLWEAKTTDPLVRAVFTMFQRPGYKLSWTATLEYLAANLLERSQQLEKKLMAKAETEEASRIILPN